jgi:hypothetical protein
MARSGEVVLGVLAALGFGGGGAGERDDGGARERRWRRAMAALEQGDCGAGSAVECE